MTNKPRLRIECGRPERDCRIELEGGGIAAVYRATRDAMIGADQAELVAAELAASFALVALAATVFEARRR